MSGTGGKLITIPSLQNKIHNVHITYKLICFGACDIKKMHLRCQKIATAKAKTQHLTCGGGGGLAKSRDWFPTG